MVEITAWLHMLTLIHRSHMGRTFLVEAQYRHSEHMTRCCCHMTMVEEPHFHLFPFIRTFPFRICLCAALSLILSTHKQQSY